MLASDRVVPDNTYYADSGFIRGPAWPDEEVSGCSGPKPVCLRFVQAFDRGSLLSLVFFLHLRLCVSDGCCGCHPADAAFVSLVSHSRPYPRLGRMEKSASFPSTIYPLAIVRCRTSFDVLAGDDFWRMNWSLCHGDRALCGETGL